MPNIKCAVCGIEVEKARFWAKYCSNRCRVIAWAQRQGKTNEK